MSSQKTVTGDFKSHFTMNKYTVVENTAPAQAIEAMKAEMANLLPLNG